MMGNKTVVMEKKMGREMAGCWVNKTVVMEKNSGKRNGRMMGKQNSGDGKKKWEEKRQDDG